LLLALCVVLLGAAVGVSGLHFFPRHSDTVTASDAVVASSGKPESSPTRRAKPVLGPAQAGSGASPTPSRAPSRRVQVTAKAVSSKKGAAMGPFAAAKTALTDSGVGWYYDWAVDPQGISAPSRVSFTPMIWGSAAATSTNLTRAKTLGDTLLGFNEPDMAAQSNMTPDQALALWPQLEATGMRLGSPAPAYGADTDGSWFDQFMKGAQSKGYRVDFLALHWYGSDFTTDAAVSQLKQYIEAVYNRWHKPIWLTEYALIKFGATSTYPTDEQQTAFVTASTRMLENLSYLERYSWFIFSPAGDGTTGTSLYTSSGTPTPWGAAYRAAG
jgi:hypothetical protein